jgi:hypothetical protein
LEEMHKRLRELEEIEIGKAVDFYQDFFQEFSLRMQPFIKQKLNFRTANWVNKLFLELRRNQLWNL